MEPLLKDLGTELLDVFKNKSCPVNCRSYIYTESHQFHYKSRIDDLFEITISKPDFRWGIFQKKPYTYFFPYRDFWQVFFTKIPSHIYRIKVEAEVEAMKLWDFISSFGGNLGLFLGGSFVWMTEKIFIQLPNSMQKLRSN